MGFEQAGLGRPTSRQSSAIRTPGTGWSLVRVSGGFSFNDEAVGGWD